MREVIARGAVACAVRSRRLIVDAGFAGLLRFCMLVTMANISSSCELRNAPATFPIPSFAASLIAPSSPVDVLLLLWLLWPSLRPCSRCRWEAQSGVCSGADGQVVPVVVMQVPVDQRQAATIQQTSL